MIRILVIEDQPAVREIISDVIEGLRVNLEVGEASSIKEAKEKLTTETWDLVVTDLSLGDGNSLALIKELTQSPTHLPPIILVSGFLSDSHIRQAKVLNIEHVLAKPFEPDVLLDCIQKVLELNDVIKPSTNQPLKQNSNLLPEMFEMDRKLGLLFRMFDEMPKSPDVSTICNNALTIAMDMVHASGGYLALYDRDKQRLVRVAAQGFHNSNLEATCSIGETPFLSLINGQEEYIETLPVIGTAQICWPGVMAQNYVGVPVYLQDIPMGVLCLTDCLGNSPLQGESRLMLGLLVKKLDTLLDNRAVHAALSESMNDTLFALVRSLEARDQYSKDHSSRVSILAVKFAQILDLDDESIRRIKTGSLLHDIGKVGIFDSVLLKPSRYTEHEYNIMKTHPIIGDSILRKMDTLVRERLIVRHHHERWDGKGYPDGIGSTEIPFEARIAGVADSIDAMMTDRVYRKAKPLSYCIEQLEFGSGKQFDPEIASIAIDAIKQGTISTESINDSFNEGIMPIQATMSPDKYF